MFPLWLKLGCSIFVGVLVPVYLRQYGAANFLWFSDIALFGALGALWLESSLLASTMAVGVLLLELVWNVDFFVRLFTGANLTGLSSYMFDGRISVGVRSLSLFHLVLPVILVWMVYRLGYDERAFVAQTALTVVVLPLSRFLSTPDENVNWAYGLRNKPQTSMPGAVYVAVLIVALPALVYLPMHLLLAALF